MILTMATVDPLKEALTVTILHMVDIIKGITMNEVTTILRLIPTRSTRLIPPTRMDTLLAVEAITIRILRIPVSMAATLVRMMSTSDTNTITAIQTMITVSRRMKSLE